MSFYTTRIDGELVDLYSIDVILRGSDERTIRLSTDMAGMATGYAFVGNPYFHTDDPHWRIKDGDSVIECEADHPLAQPVADAYLEFRDDCEYDRMLFEEMIKDEDEAMEEWFEEEEWERDMAPLYAVQDRLNGVR